MRVSGADEPLISLSSQPWHPRSSRRCDFDRDALEGWARFDARFGILREPPDVERAFRLP